MRRINKGLDLPISGDPDQTIEQSQASRRAAVIGTDFVGLKPTMEVAVGDSVKVGQLLFTDKKTPGVKFTAPASGKVTEINRGAKRAFQSLVIEVDGDGNDAVQFESFRDGPLDSLDPEVVRSHLVETGMWTAFRTRPYSKTPQIDSAPSSIFVQAIDTNPLAANPTVVLAEYEDLFRYGLQVLTRVTEGKVFLCKPVATILPGSDVAGITSEDFEGPHPAGLPGTHIHLLDPVSEKKTVWHINYQDVIAIGFLFVEGRLMTDRVISLAGPAVKKPRLLRTRLGACLDDVLADELAEGTNRVISGSVLSGRQASGPFNYLGRFHLQVSVVAEGGEREFLGWQKPGLDKFSLRRVFASAFLKPGKKFPLTTSTSGSPRAMVPIGVFEDVMPMDILPTFLLRSLIVGDTEQAQALGALELDEEDLALCTFVCPGKTEYGPLLRENLTRIEKEG